MLQYILGADQHNRPSDSQSRCEDPSVEKYTTRIAKLKMVLSVYGYLPAWGLPDISPYVTKLIFFLKMTGTQYVYKEEDLTQLDANAPKGKLPYVIDDDGTKVSILGTRVP